MVRDSRTIIVYAEKNQATQNVHQSLEEKSVEDFLDKNFLPQNCERKMCARFFWTQKIVHKMSCWPVGQRPTGAAWATTWQAPT